MNQQTTYQLLVGDVTQIFLISVGAFLLAMLLTPFYTFLAYRFRFWKKQRTTSTNGDVLEVFNKLHANKFRRNIPTMAGVIGVVTIAYVLRELDLFAQVLFVTKSAAAIKEHTQEGGYGRRRQRHPAILARSVSCVVGSSPD